ncbi:phage tail tape measure protein [Agrobacterium tumefaciens]|uniref:phage tail tape measure protein n=1 Tax=Agrobacterium tumefaciens TaxID=358 RepID=UPI0021CE98B6|nr:tail tape measure protein [Agrobacterium tumefaciens]UXT47845.1 phage tail tape measure protein [Agrobacterium tumefaciens]
MSRPDIPVTIGGDPRGFESALSRIRNAARTTAGDVITSFARVKSIGLGAAGLAGALGITTFIQAAKTAADAVANIGDEAKRAGLSAKVFQEWKYVAEQARIPVDAITDGLKELQLRADEFAITGKGSAAEAFERLGLTPQEVKEKLKDPSELLLLLVERTRQLKDTAAGIRIFDELFGGTGGERMVALIEQGEAGIRAQIKAANDFGHVLSDDVILKAQEIDRQFNAIAITVGNTLKSAIVSVVASMMDFMDSLRAVENQRASTIQSSINDVMRQKQETAQAIAAIDAADSKLNERQRNKARGTHEIKMRQLDEQENRLIKELENRPEVMNFTPKGGTVWTPPAYKPPETTGSKKSGGRSASKTATDRERESVQELIAELEEELRIVGLSDKEKRASVISRQAGSAATEDERQKIIALNEALYQEEQAREKAREAIDFQKSLLSGMITDLRNGVSAGEAFANVLTKIADRIQDQLIDALFDLNGVSGGGKGGGIFGNLFSGLFSLFSAKGDAFEAGGVHAFAKGGTFTNKVVTTPKTFRFANGTGLMGEAGPEAILPLSRASDGRLGVVAQGGTSGKGSNDIVNVVLQDDSGRMAAIADQRIETASGTIVRVSVNQSNRQVLPTLNAYQRNKAGGDYRND